jgi:type IV secretory pathway TraG/TraD family ATPase VirD4
MAELAARFLYPSHTVVTPPARSVPPADGGLYLGWGTRGPVHARPQHHALILGPPRSGKTTGLVIPSVLCHLGPAVVTSTKPDVIWATHQRRARLGTCWYWDPSGTTNIPRGLQPVTWSPIVGADIWDQAVARADALATAARPHQSAHDTHWVERAQALLAPLLHAAALAGADLAVLLSWLHRRELDMPLSILENHEARRGADLIQGLARTDSRELSGIFSTADSLLAAYRTDAALAATRDPSFDPDYFAASTDTLYLVSPAATQNLHAPLVVTLLDQIRAATYRWHPHPATLFALDELANIAPLPDLPATLAEGGSQGLIILACLQDLSQARARWDKAADGFLTLFTHKVVLPGIADPATLKNISTLAGEIDVLVTSTSRENRILGRSTTTTSSRRQKRLPEDTIANQPPGTAILISGTSIQRVAVAHPDASRSL